ncbi:MAG TPA: DUF3618 domain-containing protein [Longimicrobium sp.]|nr:DUF3618 domain-containing protein [Longimicrobium sp.]
MADYRNDDDRTLPGVGMNRTPETDPEHLIADHTSAVAPGTIPAAAMSSDPDVVRDEIERTRARMSRTINELDRALVRKKEEVQEKLDVAAPVRQRPWLYAGGVFAAGLALGLLTGGGDKRGDDDDDHVKIPRSLLEGLGLEKARGGRGRSGGLDDVEVEYTGEGSDDWELRARELMSVVARQEEEIRTLRGGGLDDAWMDDGTDVYLAPTDARLLDDVDALAEADVDDEWDEDWNFDEGEYAGEYGESYTAEYDDELEAYAERGIDFKKPLAMLFAAGVAGALGTLGKRLLGGRGHDDEELDLEVELEPRGGLAEDVYVDEAGRTARREARHRGGAMPAREYGPEYGVTGGERYTAGAARPRTGAYEARPAYDAGYTGEYDGEMEVEVELERPVKRTLPPQRRGPRVSPLAGAVAAGAAAAVSALVAKLVQNRAERASEMDVEVELEEQPRQPAMRRSPAPPRPAPAYTPQPTAQATGGEMVVEVELEAQRGRSPGAWTPSAHPEQPISGSSFGSAGTGATGTAGGTSRPSDLEVDAETRGATGATGTGNTGTGGTSGPASPPLM